MASKTKKKDEFSISLLFGGQVYKGTGATPAEALAKLPKPTKILSRGIVTVSDGTAKKELLLSPIKVKRMFFNSKGLIEAKAKVLFSALK